VNFRQWLLIPTRLSAKKYLSIQGEKRRHLG
jgi:hypothetical protein